MDEIRADLSRLSGEDAAVADRPARRCRDIAHAKIAATAGHGERYRSTCATTRVYYAGPAKTPKGYASGSFGPTTAGRMDSYVGKSSRRRLARDAGQGNRSTQVTEACHKHGGFYLGSIGGPAARLARDASSTSRYSSTGIGMEAVWKIDVGRLPAVIVVDDKGNDFYAETTKPVRTIGRRRIAAILEIWGSFSSPRFPRSRERVSGGSGPAPRRSGRGGGYAISVSSTGRRLAASGSH